MEAQMELSPLTKTFLAAIAGAAFGCVLWRWVWGAEDNPDLVKASDLLRARVVARRKAEQFREPEDE